MPGTKLGLRGAPAEPKPSLVPGVGRHADCSVQSLTLLARIRSEADGRQLLIEGPDRAKEG